MKAIPKTDLAIEVECLEVELGEAVNIYHLKKRLDSGPYPSLIVRWNGSAWIVDSIGAEIITMEEERKRQA